MSADFEYTRQGRTSRMAALLTAIYAVLTGAVVLMDAAWWLMAGLALLTLPALWDWYANPSAGVRLTGSHLYWHSGRRHGDLALAQIDHMRFDTRWDFSIRVRAVLTDGKRVHLPFEAIPPHREFEKHLQARGMAVKRSHFAFF
ncbi:hypothetical protein [Sedimentitalea nanhaiensis]|uniref:Uncharacterized protein n=1 Tax=Sedimentitalea nanhaiensis TaxID=999627 RepID=A0A1I7D5Z6_9RHOB|nr:hypothetical protein [Sedimentitalea nanhaiensis]SFU07071.1 hypothetical protein SAMN05216236_12332 [Sedimentitalea nanhaiensis]